MAINHIDLNSTYGQEALKKWASYKSLDIKSKMDTSNVFHPDDFANSVTGKDAQNGASTAGTVDDQEQNATQKSQTENAKTMKINWKMSNTQLNLKNFDGTEVNTTNFNSILNTMSLTDEQRSKLENAMQAASDVMNNSQTKGDSYGMRLSQMNMEFKYISTNLLPEKYQDTFNSYIDQYTKEMNDHYVDFEKKTAEALSQTTDSVLIDAGWQKRGQSSLAHLESGTDVYQASTKEYQNLYQNVDVTNKDTVKDQLDSVYKDILTKGTSSWWGADSQSLSSEVKYLSDKWNSFMDAMGEKSSMKLTTSINYMA